VAEVLLGLGSNVKPEQHLRAGVKALRDAFDVLQLSPVYESAAVGFSGDNFLNLVALVQLDGSLADLVQSLDAIEAANGRVENEPRLASKTLDIDVLTFDDGDSWQGCFEGVELPRPEILYHAFVLKPLADLCPERLHPVKQQSYLALWQSFEETHGHVLAKEQYIKRLELCL